METVVGVAIGVLTVVFLGSLLALIVVCRHKYCRHHSDFISRHLTDNRADLHLIREEAGGTAEVELDDVRLHPDIEKILADDQWVDDATGLVPHCLAILKKCHQLTERLVAMTMGGVSSSQGLWEAIEVARKISPRVDDVVSAMYPPLDPRLLEARCVSLILSVSHLVLVARSICGVSTTPPWVEEALADMDQHVKVTLPYSLS
ncbi:TMEM98 [Cordylochernes scorpioides]|uniref:Transmembrane protein 98 n=1 Tax=Cordylochernes scorpioides TaxID=51811 RepID=A0ABY6K072_9ARAC|nr:TMEM98 [Cordylochernes scorpioides]